METKQTVAAVGIIVVVAVAVSLWALNVVAPTGPARTHLLQGSLVGSDYVYTDEQQYYSIKALYPARVALASEAARVSAGVVIEQALKDLVEQFKKDSNLTTLTPEDIAVQGLGGERKYTFDAEYKTTISPNFVSYFYTIYQDTLGAHPNTYFRTFVFDAQGTQVRSVTDLPHTNPNLLEELSLLVSNDVTRQMRERTGQDDIGGSIFAEGLAPKEENFQNFLIDGETLVIEIPPYQVAAYAVGSFEVRIPLNEILK